MWYKGYFGESEKESEKDIVSSHPGLFSFFFLSCLTGHLLFSLFPSQIIEARFLRYQDIHTGDVMQVSS